MCSRTTCRKCGKPTWSGCGNHIEQALKGVPKSDRCQGHASDPVEPGFFAKLFGGKKQYCFYSRPASCTRFKKSCVFAF